MIRPDVRTGPDLTSELWVQCELIIFLYVQLLVGVLGQLRVQACVRRLQGQRVSTVTALLHLGGQARLSLFRVLDSHLL